MIPAAVDVERDVLGMCLNNRDDRITALGLLTVDDFHDPELGSFFAAMSRVHGRGERADAANVALELGGKRAELLALQASSPASGIGRRVEVVADLGARRRLIGFAQSLDAQARDTDIDLSDTLREVERAPELVRLAVDVPAPIDALTLASEPDEYDWLVPNLIERGDRLILTAGEGVGKSTALRSWGVMLAAGIHPFKRYNIRRLRVLLVDLENSRRQVARALRGLLAQAGESYEGGLGIECWMSGIDVRDPRGFRMLDMACELHRPDVVIIGPLYKAFRVKGRESKTDETAAEEAAFAFDRLRERHGCALLIEAHSPHGEAGDRAGLRPYGASLWLRWPEFGIAMKRLPGARAVELKHWRGARDRGRDWPEQMFEGSRWPWEAAA